MKKQFIDRHNFGSIIYPLMKAGRYEEAVICISNAVKAFPHDPFPVAALAQNRISMFLASGRENFSKPEGEQIITILKESIALIDNKLVKTQHTALNDAAFIHVLLATAYLHCGNPNRSNNTFARKALQAAEYVTKREFQARPDYYIEPETLAEAFSKQVVALDRLKESPHKLQSAMVGAIANYRKAGNKVMQKKMLEAHVQMFGYAPISMDNLQEEFPKFVESSIRKNQK
ncbi:MAG TPA: hypothetical protein V6C65_04005 [Allocoleopsis sp.]